MSLRGRVLLNSFRQPTNMSAFVWPMQDGAALRARAGEVDADWPVAGSACIICQEATVWCGHVRRGIARAAPDPSRCSTSRLVPDPSCSAHGTVQRPTSMAQRMTLGDREISIIQRLKNVLGLPVTKIALAVGRNKTTVYKALSTEPGQRPRRGAAGAPLQARR